MKHWLQVDLSVPSEFAEPISNFLMEQGADGIEEVDEDRQQEKAESLFPSTREREEGSPCHSSLFDICSKDLSKGISVSASPRDPS